MNLESFFIEMNTKILAVCILLLSSAFGASKPPVTKIVIHYIASDLPENAPGAKPKTIYLAGERYARIEEDIASGEKGAIIVNQPDIWVVDLKNKKGTHQTNLGPDFTVHNPIFGPDCPDELFELEFGREIEFLRRAGAKSLEPKQIGGRQCEAWELERDHHLVVIYVDAKNKLPVQLKAFKDGEMKFTVEYLSYDTGLPFDSSLFNPPADINISEASR